MDGLLVVALVGDCEECGEDRLYSATTLTKRASTAARRKHYSLSQITSALEELLTEGGSDPVRGLVSC